MNIHFLLLFLLATFLISTKWYIFICRQASLTDNKFIQEAFFPIYTFSAIGFILFSLTCPQTDTVNDIRWYFGIIPCVFPLCVFLSQAYFTKLKKWGLTYLVSLVSVFLLPKDFLLFKQFLPFIADRLVLSLILYIYTVNFNLLNTFKGTSAAQMLLISLGAFALYVYGAISESFNALSISIPKFLYGIA